MGYSVAEEMDHQEKVRDGGQILERSEVTRWRWGNEKLRWDSPLNGRHDVEMIDL